MTSISHDKMYDFSFVQIKFFNSDLLFVRTQLSDLILHSHDVVAVMMLIHV